jgi:hypothetical protein
MKNENDCVEEELYLGAGDFKEQISDFSST